MDAREQIFNQLIEDCGGGIARLASSYVRNRAEREDLVQEIWLAIWRALPAFRGESRLRTFVYRIAHNRSVTQLARRRDSHGSELLEELQDERPGPEAQLQQNRDAERLVRAVSLLPLGMRQVLTLRFEGLSYSEISEVLGISESNVAVRLNRARERLNTKLGNAV
ncbi:RNA polymerase sigma factor [Microbulbifer sp. YPW1]|uniref:RNA polymerase sigma factor n=1 Tax=Microbulbifer sp. YPW1 TaxID=2745199 RepID=UPI00159A4BE8|nr:sigma-70 family RNA polymerase sigma factor [Microbulbifer sp. YPW1]QKX16350.1 sigma-70 family RNA polymerase sigma factor [Microbulbifer sp. YPW1]